jgi:transcription elongation factor Elf1
MIQQMIIVKQIHPSMFNCKDCRQTASKATMLQRQSWGSLLCLVCSLGMLSKLEQDNCAMCVSGVLLMKLQAWV